MIFSARLLHLPRHRLVNLVNFDIGLVADMFQPAGDRLIGFGFQLLERQQLHLAHIFVHADPLGERRVDIHRLLGDAAALFGAFDEMQRPHIVQPVSELDQKHADIVRNREQEFAQILRRALILGLRLDFRQLGNAIDQPRNFRPEARLDVFNRRQRVLHRVVEQGGDDRVLVHFEVGHQPGDLDRMAEIRVARSPLLRAVHLDGIDIGAVQPILIDIGRHMPAPAPPVHIAASYS